MGRVTPEKVRKDNLGESQIVLVGTNMQGRHGKGFAKYCKENLGLRAGASVGFVGQCYAIPTKETPGERLGLDVIKSNVDQFLNVAKSWTNSEFLVTKIGMGLAGYELEDIAPMFLPAICLKNVWLPIEFWRFYALQLMKAVEARGVIKEDTVRDFTSIVGTAWGDYPVYFVKKREDEAAFVD